MQYKNRKDGRYHFPVKKIRLNDGTILGIFEGSRGANPDHDILIKYQEEGKRVRTPRHIHWVIDLLIKKEHNRELTLRFMRYLRDMYDRVDGFKTKEERANFDFKETTDDKLKPFHELNKYGEYKVDFIGYLIELMIKMEKNTPEDKPAKVFKELMDSMIAEKEIFAIVSKALQKKIADEILSFSNLFKLSIAQNFVIKGRSVL